MDYFSTYSVLVNIFNRRIVWYFVAKRNKKKREEEFQRQLALEREKIKAAGNIKTISRETPQNTEPTNAEENKTMTIFLNTCRKDNEN